MNGMTPLRSALTAVGAALLLQACEPTKPARPPAPPQVSVLTVHHENVPITVELPGRTSAYLVAQVRARVDGIVRKRYFTEGSEVKQGQRLYQIDPAPYLAALAMARASLQKAEASLVAAAALAARYRPMVAIDAVSQQDLDNAVSARDMAAADVANARAAVANAEINVGYTDVVAPITGRTGLSLVTVGAYVQASSATLMTTAQQIDPIYVDLAQSSVAGLQLRRDVAGGKLKADGPGQARVALLLEDGTEYPLSGHLLFSDISVDQATGSVTMRAAFPNPQSVLLPGMFVRARIQQGVAEAATLVPQEGITHDPQGQATALVVGPDGRVEARTLTLAGTRGADWIVENGLADGERVIVAGTQKVRPGVLVQAIEVRPAEVAAAGSR